MARLISGSFPWIFHSDGCSEGTRYTSAGPPWLGSRRRLEGGGWVATESPEAAGSRDGRQDSAVRNSAAPARRGRLCTAQR